MAKTLSNTSLTITTAAPLQPATGGIALEALESEVSFYATTGYSATTLGTITLQESFDGGTTWVNHPTFTITSVTAGAYIGKAIVHAPLIRLSSAGSTALNLPIQIKVNSLRFTQQFPGAITNPITFTANGTSASFLVNDYSIAGSTTTVNGDKQVPWTAQGTWGGGTLALQASPDGGTNWFQVDTATANIKKLTKPVTDQLFRFVLTGATAPSLTVWVVV